MCNNWGIFFESGLCHNQNYLCNYIYTDEELKSIQFSSCYRRNTRVVMARTVLFALFLAVVGASETPLRNILEKRSSEHYGYGYAANGLNTGYFGNHHGVIENYNAGNIALPQAAYDASFAGPITAYNGAFSNSGLYRGSFGIGAHGGISRTVTRVEEVPIRVPVEKPIPVPVERQVPYPVKVPVPHPVEVVRHAPYPVKELVRVPVHVPAPYPVERQVPYPVRVPVERPVPVQVPVPQPYPVEKQVHVPVQVPVPQPYPVVKQVPYPVEVRVPVPQPYPVVKEVTVPVRVPVERPYPVPVPAPYPVEKAVPVNVPYEKPYPVPVQVPVERPVPVPVEKAVPVPVKVPVPEPYPVYKQVPVEVEKLVRYPVTIPVERPIPVGFEKPVPVPVENPVPVPVRAPISDIGLFRTTATLNEPIPFNNNLNYNTPVGLGYASLNAPYALSGQLRSYGNIAYNTPTGFNEAIPLNLHAASYGSNALEGPIGPLPLSHGPHSSLLKH